MKILRVFPRKTSFTPTDELAFVGYPQLWRPEADEVHVSVTFTWDINMGQMLQEAWRQYYPVVKIGGPTIEQPNGDFTPGLYVKPGVVFTSRGCDRKCPWCIVPKNEGHLRLLPIRDGYIVQDNNLLATPHDHQERVYAMLRQQKRAAYFSGGVDARLVDDWFVEQIKTLRVKRIFLACDTKQSLIALTHAVDKLGFLGREKLFCYVLIGFRGEKIEDAYKRLRDVWNVGVIPFAQLYRSPTGSIIYNHDWKELARIWSRPCAMKQEMKGATENET